jgi:hypothetical protein
MHQLNNIVTNAQDVGEKNKNFQRIRQTLLKHNIKKNV